MTSTSHTWTTVGLDDRENAVLKALMAVVAGKTAVRWQYVEGLVVTLAFCQPDSPMARLAQRRHASHGLPHCISVPRPGQEPLPGTRAINVRMRVGDFIVLLDEITAKIQAAAGKPARNSPPGPPAVDARAAPGPGFELALLLHQWQADPEPRAALIEAGDTWLQVCADSRSYIGSDADAAALCRALQPHGSTLRLAPAGRPAAGDSAPRPLEELLWACGHLDGGALLPWLPGAARFGLHRWPDFGRLAASPAAIALAAMMVRGPQPCSVLVTHAGGNEAEVLHFINACAMAGLLQVEADDQAVAAAAPDMGVVPTPGRWSGVLGRIRSALGMERQ